MFSLLLIGCTHVCTCWVFWQSHTVSTFKCEGYQLTVYYSFLLTHVGRFHSGSLAFGALIIALVQLARAILGYIQKKLKGRAGKVAQCILCCMQCCLWCLEKILKYINRQAYIEVSSMPVDSCTQCFTQAILQRKASDHLWIWIFLTDCHIWIWLLHCCL